jgi:dUTP pyrophosphatase
MTFQNCAPTKPSSPSSPQIEYKLLNSDGKIPVKSTSGSAGYDIYYSGQEVAIPSNEKVTLCTGLCLIFPKGIYARIAPRSGLAVNKDIEAFCGTIDTDYKDEIKVVLRNFGKSPYTVKHHDRIAQLIFEYSIDADFHPFTQQAQKDNETSSHKGFGSTGH